MCLSYAGAVYRLPYIYIGVAGEAFRFVSFRSSPNNFSATRDSHPPSLSFSLPLSPLRPLSLSLSLSFSPSLFLRLSLFVRRSSRLRIFVRIAIAEGFFPLASLVAWLYPTGRVLFLSFPFQTPVFLPLSFLRRHDLRVKQYFTRTDTRTSAARPDKTGRVKIVSTCSMTDRVPSLSLEIRTGH